METQPVFILVLASPVAWGKALISKLRTRMCICAVPKNRAAIWSWMMATRKNKIDSRKIKKPEQKCIRLFYFYCVDRKSTRLNSSHVKISYAVFCLKKKKIINKEKTR